VKPYPSAASPWQNALGDRFDDLHPRLRAYFGPIPEGSVGRGRGVFDAIGTPKRWLWPAFAVLARSQVLFPVWQRNVAFTVTNTPGATLAAERTFEFEGGPRTMRDAVSWRDGTLRDVLGVPPRIEVVLDADVVDGGLRLTSTRTVFLLGRLKARIPGAPRLRLSESIGDDGRQHVDFALTAPVIGRIYEYRGVFDYRVESA
jgi:hypothetical protein